jgi:hypothetical protein
MLTYRVMRTMRTGFLSNFMRAMRRWKIPAKQDEDDYDDKLHAQRGNDHCAAGALV